MTVGSFGGEIKIQLKMKFLVVFLFLALAFIQEVESFLLSGSKVPNSPRSRDSDSGPLFAKYDWRRSPNKWTVTDKPAEPGFGGPWPGDPNAPKFKVTVKNVDEGTEVTHMVPIDRYIFFQFEEDDIPVPIISGQRGERMCRNGCCTTCAVKVVEGKVKQDAQIGLMKELRKEGYALMCCAYPRSDLVLEVTAEDECYIKQWGESFESGGVEWGGFLPEDD
mmetsp:Transcript_40526/g.59700  ORF Transcript_40526/g.59700 Transcript_40526/m.59700 type:complete len:221 (+) Transcript_40526:99-761(+)